MKNLIIDSQNFFHKSLAGIFGSAQTNEHIITFNFIRNFKAIIQQFAPDKVYLVLEGHPKHRYALYPEYKANRIVKEGQEEKKSFKAKFFEETNIILQLLQLFPVTIVKHQDFECDDVINTLVHSLNKDENIVITSDTDFYQLLETSNCKVYNSTKKVFLEKFPYPYVVHKSLVGDKSDNIKRLMSEKKAEKLLDSPELFEEYLSTTEHQENFNINHQLIKFSDVPVEELQAEEYEFDLPALIDKFEEYKFESLLKESYLTVFTEVFSQLASKENYP